MKSADSLVLPSPVDQTSNKAFTFNGELEIKPCLGETVRLVPDLFQYLRTILKSDTCSLPIHDLLSCSREDGEFSLIKSHTGDIRCYEGASAASQFFHASRTKEGLVYAFQSDNSAYSYFSIAEVAAKVWKSTSASYKRMIKLSLRCRSARSVRVVWTRSEGTTRTLEQSMFSNQKVKGGRRENRLRTTLMPSKAAHSSHLQKSSFSPFLPYTPPSSTLSHTTNSLTPTHKKKNPVPIFAHSKTCNGSALECEWLNETVPVAQEVDKEVIELVKKMMHANEVLDSFCYDLEEESALHWRVLAIKWVETVSLRSSELSTSPSEASSSARMRTLKNRFAAVLTPKSGKRPPYIDSAEIQQRNIDRYLRCVTSLPADRSPRVSDPTLTPISESLSTISQKFDGLMSAASYFRNTNKEGMQVKFDDYRPDILEQVIERVYAKVRSEPMLRSFFEGKNRLEINMIKMSLAKALSGVENCYFRKSVKDAHSGLGINSTQFSCFIRIFRDIMFEEGIRSSDIDTVLKYLSRFSREIVEDET